MALDYATYYVLGFLWGIFFRDLWFATSILAYFQVFFFFVFGPGSATVVEYWFWLPLTGSLGLIIGIALPLIINGPYLIAYDTFFYGWYTAKILIEFAILNALVVFWEVLPISPFPWGGVVELLAYSIAIFVIYWLNRRDFVWAVPNGNGAWVIKDCPLIFHIYWAAFFLPAILIFTILAIISLSFWQFWVALFIFVVSSIALIIVYFTTYIPVPAKTIK